MEMEGLLEVIRSVFSKLSFPQRDNGTINKYNLYQYVIREKLNFQFWEGLKWEAKPVSFLFSLPTLSFEVSGLTSVELNLETKALE